LRRKRGNIIGIARKGSANGWTKYAKHQKKLALIDLFFTRKYDAIAIKKDAKFFGQLKTELKIAIGVKETVTINNNIFKPNFFG
jgi:hypothetical protein